MAGEGFSITEWLENAKTDQKVAAQPFLIIGALLFLGWKFIYSPYQVTLTKELKKNKGIQDQINALEAAVADKDKIALEVNDYRKAMEAAEKMCYKKSEAPLFLQHLRNLGKQAQLEIKSITPQPMIQKSFETLTYEEFPVKITFQGTFSQLGIFLRILETQPKLIKVQLPPLAPDASGTFKFDLMPTAIVIPDVREAPPPAEPTE